MFLKTSSCLLTCTIYFRSLDTTLFAQNNVNNISTSPDQISLGSPCFTADATTSLLSVQMNNLGITSGTPFQPETSHVKKFTELQRVHDVENSHGVSHDRPAPTSLQSNSMVRSIDRPKQTTDVSRQGTEESVYTNLTGKQLEPKLVGASASNHEVKGEYSIWCIKAILRCLSVRNALLCVIKEYKLLVHVGQTTSYKKIWLSKFLQNHCSSNGMKVATVYRGHCSMKYTSETIFLFYLLFYFVTTHIILFCYIDFH